MPLPLETQIMGHLHLCGRPCTFDEILTHGVCRGWETESEILAVQSKLKATLDELTEQGRIYRLGSEWSKYPFLEGYAMAKKAKSANDDVVIPCEFGGVSLGDQTCRLGVRIGRDNLSITKADQFLCGRRINGIITLSGKKDSPGQQHLFKSALQIRGIFDIKRIGLSPSEISCGLTFNKADTDVAVLANFAKGAGSITIDSVEELPDGTEPDEETDAEE